MTQDWTGNKKSTYVTLGASNHVEEERADRDFYATQPDAIDGLLKHETFSNNIWEISAGNGHLSERLKYFGYTVKSTDIVKREYPVVVLDFLESKKEDCGNRDIITNPPYNIGLEFCQHAIELIENERKVAMFLKLTFLEGQKRRKFFNEHPPKKVLVYSARMKCAKNGNFENTGSSAACYAWFVWEKNFKGKPTIDWI